MLTSEIAPQIVAQCQVAAGEIGQAFTRALGSPIEATVDEPTSLRLLDAPEQLESPGVVVTLHCGPAALAILIPQSGGVLPRGYDSADPKAQSKLTTLAQELGMLVLPEAFLAEDAQGFCVADLAGALRDGGADDSASVVSLSLRSAGRQIYAYLIWPLPGARQIVRARNAGKVEESPAQSGEPQATVTEIRPTLAGEVEASIVREMPGGVADGEASNAANRDADLDLQAAAASASKKKAGARGPGLRDLPPYSRSLLKIRVPLSVTLAEKKQPLGQVLEIGPGSILQFEKSCEEMLDLNVSNLPIARGEAVKVGDKFGLRVTSLILPSERFKAVQPALHASPPTTK
jgi:flagellar motor switch/type III secretory pathway protein FliN